RDTGLGPYQRAPGTSGERRGESTRNARGDSAGTPQLVESERINVRGYDQRLVHGTRSKRAAFIVDGTVWCGVGDTADNYTDLGVHRETDICCRDHDHCPEKIAGLSWGYGLFNFVPYTVNLCSCDESFRLCLRAADTTVATEVGQFFFDTLRPSCFELSDELTARCVRRYWYGLCREYGPLERTAVVGTNRHFNGEQYDD
ncbi:acidic phospholipase A2 PA4-like, partial [Patiria miniata]|uniref:Phospholipase A2-like central domain-containing protein n=1 Tax=Patiria miniata TaxID=46514 RepID=A0A913ZT77_PATMI